MQVTHKNGLEMESKETSLNQLWNRYASYWPWFVFLLLLAVGAACLFMRYAIPKYESTARLLIKDEKKGVEDSKGLESLNLISTKKILENEMEVLQSRSLVKEVVNNLQLYAPVYEERELDSWLPKNKWISENTNKASAWLAKRGVAPGGLPAYTISPITIKAKSPDSLREVKKIPFTYSKAEQKVIIGVDSFPLKEWVQTPYGTLQFEPNNRLSDTAYVPEGQLYFTLLEPKKVIADIQDRLVIASASKLSSILNLTIRDEVPERGEDILNELLSAYNVAMLKDKNTLAANTLRFVEDRLNHVARDLSGIENKIEKYKSSQEAVDVSEQGKLFLENVSANDQKLSEIDMKLAVLDQVEHYVKQKDNNSSIAPSTLGVTDPVLSNLLDKLYELDLEYEKKKGTTAENNPLLSSVTDQINRIKPGILENIQNQRRSLQASRTNLASTNSGYTSVLQTIPKKERDLIEISRQQSTMQSIYAFLLQKKEETALSYAANVSDSRVVDRASSTVVPVSPKTPVVFAIAIIIALTVGVVWITLKELFNRKIMYRQDIERLTNHPIIAEISVDKSKNPIVIGANNRTFVAEQFRKLRVALNYLGVNTTNKKVLVTSGISGEGKSFIATNLALSMALTGKKVVLLEMDLHSPAISEYLKISADVGISSYLLGTREPEEIIRRTEVNENLFFVPAGPLSANPTELLMSNRLPDLLNYLDGIFDYIIIDSAPVAPVTDAYIISPYCDATLYIIRHRHTPKVLVEQIDKNSKVNILKNMAIVFNGIRPRGFGKHHYGYGYGYGDGYAYKEKRKQKTSFKPV
ncbi:polysaccharide biosynthesis tyrosine autokinase [Niastella caeni]|uniref:Polysaccharide biosynthesis tyrosine autokinase n=1 Tax=Niastella caeni TaxID=2569763 RepID=A0A4S8HZH4_9BACT|nr:polysaccharide biosynthesis tyrosine autokinase [Niastella caeni]THU40975.1 polysaccharide biosynthesis tyrosine autokinase [Niastella caeni]